MTLPCIRRLAVLVLVGISAAVSTPDAWAAESSAPAKVAAATGSAAVRAATEERRAAKTARKPDKPPKPAPQEKKPSSVKWSYDRRLTLTAEYDETIPPRTGRADGGESDLVGTINPSLSATARTGGHSFSGAYQAWMLTYDDLDERDSQRHDGRLRWNGPLGSSLKGAVQERIYYLQDVGGEATEVITTPTTYRMHDIDSSVVYSATAWLELSMRVQNTDIEYEAARQNDSNSWYVSPQARAILSPTASVDLGYIYKDYAVERSDPFSSHELQVGYNHRFASVLWSRLSVGAIYYPETDEYTTSLGAAVYRRFGKGTLALSYTRSDWLQRAESDVVERDLLTVSYSTPIGEQWSAYAYVSYLRDISLDSERIDTETFRTRFRLSRPINKWLSAQVEHQYTDQVARGTTGDTLDGHTIGTSLTIKW